MTERKPVECWLTRTEARFIATNPDPTGPSPEGSLPAAATTAPSG